MEFQYQETHRFFAQTQRGLEPVALEELEELEAMIARAKSQAADTSDAETSDAKTSDPDPARTDPGDRP